MLSSGSNVSSCEVSQIILDVNDILQRITPIEFIPIASTSPFIAASSLGTLTVQSDMEVMDVEMNNAIANELYAESVYSPVISANTVSCTTTKIGNTTITSSGSTLQLPANTTIGGSPVSGTPIQYLFWCGSSNNSFGNMTNGYIYIDRSASATSTTAASPYLLPVNGTLRSFYVGVIFGVSGNTFPITNFTVSVYANSTQVTSAIIDTISAAGTYLFGNNSLNYSASMGALISLQYTFSTGTFSSNSNSARGSVGWIPS